MSAITDQVSVSSVAAALATAAGAAVGLVFLWWGARKAKNILMAAFTKGKLSL